MRVFDLHAFRQIIVSCSLQGDPAVVRSTAVVVPTRGASHHLSRLFQASAGERADVPAILTRDELYLSLNTRLDKPLGILTGSEREVILHASAAQAAGAGLKPPFPLRPGWSPR